MSDTATELPADEAVALRAQVRTLLDERAAVDAVYRYCHTIDVHDREGWLDCFTSDGVFRYDTTEGEELFRFTGQDELAGWLAGHIERTPLGHMNHVVINPRVVVDGETATITTYYLGVRPREGGPGIASAGRYHIALARSDDGVWRIRDLLCAADMPRPAA